MAKKLIIKCLFGYDSITVSYAWELISVSMCYSQRYGFNTSLSRLCTVPASLLLTSLTYLLTCLTCVCTGSGILCNVLGIVIFGGTVMCYPGRH